MTVPDSYLAQILERRFHVMATFSNAEESGHHWPIPDSNDARSSVTDISSSVPSLFRELDPLSNNLPLQRNESPDHQGNMNNNPALSDPEFNKYIIFKQ